MFFTNDPVPGIPLVPVSESTRELVLGQLSTSTSTWLEQNRFNAKPGSYCLVPGPGGEIERVFFGVYEADDQSEEAAPIWSIAALASVLPAAVYHLECDWDSSAKQQAAIGWGLGSYQFRFFKADFVEQTEPLALLRVDQENLQTLNAFVDSFTLVRDMVNAPANHMMPEDLSEVTQEIAQQFGAAFSEIVGEALLDQNYPAIHAVGRASDHEPRLLRLDWGRESDPLLCLVGKGVCFDTGGLDLKPAKFMRLMKKDMGGAAHVLGLAHLIMSHQLPLRLQVLIPAVDNAVAGDAFRPGDVLDTRSGKTVEVDNTDAEGRLVLCDALSFAAEQQPDLIVDFATLTGAARVAVGTEIPALFSNRRSLLLQIQQSAQGSGELVWPLPLHKPYRSQLDSAIADFMNSSAESYGGAITAALYLNEFVPESIEWAHLDVMAWNNRDRVGRPKGGEAMGLLTLFEFLRGRYTQSN